MKKNERVDIRRKCVDSLLAEVNRKEVSILLGPRQVGKTYLLKQLRQMFESQGLSTHYYNLELPSDLLIFQKSDQGVFDMLTQSDAQVIFIDEFHYLPNASHIFKAIYDSDLPIKLYVSGSSSMEIHKHLKESLAGRRLVTRIGPLSAQEFFEAFPNTSKDQLLSDYLTYGGLPGLVHLSDSDSKIQYLDEMIQTYIQKDIKSLLREENIRAFNAMMYLLAQNQGQLVSVNSLANEVGLTARTLERYLSIMESTYTLFSLHSFSGNLGNELKKSRKVYLYDLGIRNALLRDFRRDNRPDSGTILESYVVMQYLLAIKPNQELKFWRTRHGDEIDLVVLENRVPTMIEVKASAQEIPKAFRLFKKNYLDTRVGIIYTGVAGDACTDREDVQLRDFFPPLF